MFWFVLLSFVYLVVGFATLILSVSGRERPMASGLVGFATIAIWPVALPFALAHFVLVVLGRMRGRRQRRRAITAGAEGTFPR